MKSSLGGPGLSVTPTWLVCGGVQTQGDNSSCLKVDDIVCRARKKTTFS